MNIPSKIPFATLAEFINSQADETPLNMMENYFDKPCGCILIQFGRKIFPKSYINECIESYSGAGWRHLGVDCEFEIDAKMARDFISECITANVKNYKRAKEILSEYVVSPAG